MDADGSNVVNTGNGVTPDRDPAWSPDGTKIAYFIQATNFATMNSDGTNPVVLNGFVGGISNCCWQNLISIGRLMAGLSFLHGNAFGLAAKAPESCSASSNPLPPVAPSPCFRPCDDHGGQPPITMTTHLGLLTCSGFSSRRVHDYSAPVLYTTRTAPTFTRSKPDGTNQISLSNVGAEVGSLLPQTCSRSSSAGIQVMNADGTGELTNIGHGLGPRLAAHPHQRLPSPQGREPDAGLAGARLRRPARPPTPPTAPRSPSRPARRPSPPPTTSRSAPPTPTAAPCA